MSSARILFGRKVKEIRKNSGLTQDIFSEMIDIEPSSLSNIENGKSFPSMNTVLKIMEKFNVKPQDFFDTDYLDDNEKLEEKIYALAKQLSRKNKQIVYRIMLNFK